MQKPRLSFWQIWNMSFGFLGIQFGWGLQMANMSPIYKYLGASDNQIPMLWLDNDREIIGANAAARLFLRRPLRQVRALRVDDLIPAAAMPELEQGWRTLMGDGLDSGTIPVRLPDGPAATVDFCSVANLLPGAHLVVATPTRWPDDELMDYVPIDVPRPGALTARERDVLTLVAHGLDVRAISERLALSPSTVKTHLRNALRRLGARNRAHAIAIAMRDGLIT